MNGPVAVGVKFPRLDVLEKHKGTHPIVLVGSQDRFAPAANPASLPAIDLTKGIDLIPPHRGNLVILIDGSSSMNFPATPGGTETRLQHLEKRIGELAKLPMMKGFDISVLVYNDTTKDLTNKLAKNVKNLASVVAGITPRGATYFDKAYLQAERIFAEDVRRHGVESRNVLIQMTDGIDADVSKGTSPYLLKRLAALNVATIFIGVGSEYDQKHLFELSKHAGFAGVAHTPAPQANSVFSNFVPRILTEVQTAETYLAIRAIGKATGFYGVTPSIHEVPTDDRLFRAGYWSKPLGVMFAGGSDAGMKLRVQTSASKWNGVETDIPIVAYDSVDLGSHERGLAKMTIETVLMFLAQNDGGVEDLKRLKAVAPGNDQFIDSLIQAQRNATVDPGASMSARADVGSMASMASFQLPPNGLHSGELGPLDLPPPRAVPGVGVPNPGAYNPLIPTPSLKGTLKITGAVNVTSLGLEKLADGEEIKAGRSRDCEIILRDELASRTHAAFRRVGKTLEVSDKGALNGTYVNGTKIAKPTVLKDGDRVTFGKAQGEPNVVFAEVK